MPLRFGQAQWRQPHDFDLCSDRRSDIDQRLQVSPRGEEALALESGGEKSGLRWTWLSLSEPLMARQTALPVAGL
jgi:hypothetical protein